MYVYMYILYFRRIFALCVSWRHCSHSRHIMTLVHKMTSSTVVSTEVTSRRTTAAGSNRAIRTFLIGRFDEAQLQAARPDHPATQTAALQVSFRQRNQIWMFEWYCKNVLFRFRWLRLLGSIQSKSRRYNRSLLTGSRPHFRFLFLDGVPHARTAHGRLDRLRCSINWPWHFPSKHPFPERRNGR